jgi:hypothetical protein
METSAVEFHWYLQPTLGRDNDRAGEHSATVNALQSQPVELPPPPEADQETAVIRPPATIGEKIGVASRSSSVPRIAARPPDIVLRPTA